MAWVGWGWSVAWRPQDTALPEGNRSGGRSPKGLMPRVVVWAQSAPRHSAAQPKAPWPNAVNSGGLGAGPQGCGVALWRGWCLRWLSTPAGSGGLAVRVRPFAGAAPGLAGAVFDLFGDASCETVAAAVDGDDFGAVQQVVEDDRRHFRAVLSFSSLKPSYKMRAISETIQRRIC